MRSSNTGLVYERNTIELWLDSHGHVCPVTGEPLEFDDLFLDEQLQDRICRWHVTKVCNSSSQGAADLFGDSEAIYDFLLCMHTSSTNSAVKLFVIKRSRGDYGVVGYINSGKLHHTSRYQ